MAIYRFTMSIEFRVMPIDSRLNFVEPFQQIRRYEAQLKKEIIGKMGFMDGDFLEIKGKRTTVAKVVSVDKENFTRDAIGLNDFIRNNARVLPEETVSIRKADIKIDRKIVLAPIGEHLRRSELLKMIAKKSFVDTPFVEGDVTYLRSKILKYLIG